MIEVFPILSIYFLHIVVEYKLAVKIIHTEHLFIALYFFDYIEET